MGYCTVTDVETYSPVRAPFSAQTKPSASQVAALIEAAGREVNDHLLRAGYPAPVPTSATYAYAVIADTTAKVTAYMIEQVAPSANRRDNLKQMRDAALKMIDDGEILGLAKDLAEAGPRSNFGQSPPAFTKEMQL